MTDSETPRRGRSTAVRAALWTLLALAMLVALIAAALPLITYFRQQAADQAWAASFESMDALLARFPSVPTNKAAAELAALASPVGLSLLPDVVSGATAQTVSGFLAIGAFLATIESKTDDAALAPPPAEVASFLSRTTAEFAAIETHLTGSGPLVWATDLSKGLEGPMPDLEDQPLLARALLVRALEASRHSDRRAAQQSLDAFRNLHAGIRDRPELIAQLISASMGYLHNAVLRQIGSPPDDQVVPVTGFDWKLAYARSLQAEVARLGTTVRQGRTEGMGVSPTRARLLQSTRNTFLLNLLLADYSLRMARLASEIRAEDPCTAAAAAAASRRLEEAVPWWNPLAKSAMTGVAQTWRTFGRVALDDELTRLVIQARARVHDVRRSAPPEPAVRSAVCANVTWTITTQPNGDVVVEATGALATDIPRPLFRVRR